MEGFALDIQKRTTTGRSSVKEFRKTGFIPAIVYHRAESSVPSVVSYKEFTKLATQARLSQVFIFQSNDSYLNGKSALVRDIQKDPVSGRVIHVDFQALKDDEKITVSVPLKFVGEAVGVKQGGGTLSVHTHELDVSCLPKDIPLEIEVSVVDLNVGSHVHAEDLILPSGVLLKDAKDLPIVSVVIIKEEVIAPVAVAVEGVVAAEGAEAAPAAAAAPADEKAPKEKEKKG